MKKNKKPIFSGRELSKLKESVLNATLNNQTFPGSNITLSFPDLPFVLTQSDLYLVDNDINKTIVIDKINKPLHIVSVDFIKQMADKHGKVIYFEFQVTESKKDNLVLALDAKIFSSSDQRTNNLSGIRIEFQKAGKDWKIIGEPAYLSA